MQLHFRKCTRNDLETLLNISKTTFIDTFEKHINPDDFRNYVASAFNEDSFSSQLNNTNAHFYFVYVNHDLAGYFKLNTLDAQTDINDPDAVELERIYILKSFQRQKTGTPSGSMNSMVLENSGNILPSYTKLFHPTG